MKIFTENRITIPEVFISPQVPLWLVMVVVLADGKASKAQTSVCGVFDLEI